MSDRAETGDVLALLARIVACDGGHGSYGFDARIGFKARDEAVRLIIATRPGWTARQEWIEAWRELHPDAAFPAYQPGDREGSND